MTKSTTDKLLEKYYAGPKFDGTTMFYDFIRTRIFPGCRILNVGAGPATEHRDRQLRQPGIEIVGADIDPVVLTNPEVDSAVLIENGKIPLADATFDIAFSDFVLEHVEHPEAFMREIYRLLKPGGCYFFRTPNIYHYVSVVSRFTPHAFHRLVAHRVRTLSNDVHEPWPTFYRMNTRPKLRSIARKAGFVDTEIRMIECEPSYLQFHAVPFLLGMAYERTVNATPLLEGLRTNMLGRCDKAAAGSA